MIQQPAPAPADGGGIIINGHVEGEGIAIGPGAQAYVVKNYYQAKISDTQVQRLVAEVKAELLPYLQGMNNAGVRPEVVPLPGLAELVSVRDPFTLPVGISPLPAGIAPADAQQWLQQIAPLDQRLRQLDQRLSVMVPGERRVVRELVIGQERVNLVDLLLQQGNLAFWSFRQEAARLFADQVSAYYLTQPAWPILPPLQAFHTAALSNLEVHRAWVLYQRYRLYNPAMTGPYLTQLSQGRWREVLQAWFFAKQITAEAFQYEHAYLKAIGERYDPQAVRVAAQQTEACFAEAVRRQPDNSIALVNWGAIKAETGLFFSIENGALDRARLAGAEALFNYAGGQLGQRRDREGQIALGLCLLHDATRLPPNADLGAVPWATQHTAQMRQEWSQGATQGTIQWEMVQRNWARRDGRFFDEQKVRRAREILVAAEASALLFHLDEKLTAHAQMLDQIRRWTIPGTQGQPPASYSHPPEKDAGAISRRALLRVGIGVGIGAGTIVVAGSAAAIAYKAGLFSSPATSTPTPAAAPIATFTPPPPPTSTPTSVPPTSTPTSIPLPRISEYSIPTTNSGPYVIAAGPDGNLWFTEEHSNQIGRITPQGTITEFRIATANSYPSGIATGPDGNLWFIEAGSNRIGNITPQGVINDDTGSINLNNSTSIVAGPDGNLWFTEFQGNKIGQITPLRAIREFPLPSANSGPSGITAGPDGKLWFTEFQSNKIGHITPQVDSTAVLGSIREFPLPSANSGPSGITAGPDGNFWFTEFQGNKIGRITPQGVITEFPLPSANSGPSGIAAGPDGNLWFTEQNNSKIGRITPRGMITEFPLPSANSGPSGIVAGPDGNLWFTEGGSNKIGRIMSGQ